MNRFFNLIAQSISQAILALVAFAFVFAPAVSFANTAWLGTTSANWSDGANNWNGGVPTITSGVLFNAQSTGTLTTNQDIPGLTVLSISNQVVPGVAGTTPISIGGLGFTIDSGGITNPGATQDLSINTDVSLSASQSWNQIAGRTLTLGATPGSKNLALSTAGANTLTLAWTGAGTIVLNDNISDGATSSAITTSAASNLAATIRFAGNNNYSGGTTITARTENIQVASDTAFGNGLVTFAAAGNPAVISAFGGDHTVGNDISMANGFQVSGTNNLTFGGAVKLTGSKTLSTDIPFGKTVTFSNTVTLGPDNGAGAVFTVGLIGTPPVVAYGTIDFAGVIKDPVNATSPGSIVVPGNGNGATSFATLQFDNQNTFSGGITISGQGATLLIGSSSVTSPSFVSGPLGTGTVTPNNGTTPPRIQAIGAARSVANNFTLSSSLTVQGSQDLTFTGIFTNSGGNRTLTVTNTGMTTFGTINLSEANATARTLNVNGAGNITLNGVIQNVDPSLGSGTGGTLNFNGTYAGIATINGTNTYSGATTLSSGTFVVGNKKAFGTSAVGANGVSVSASTDLSGANAISNTVTFGGNNTITGNNNIELSGLVTDTGTRTLTNNMSSGTLTLSGGLNLSSTSSNFTLTVNGTGNTLVNSVIGNGTGGSTASLLTKSGAGTLTLSAANTYGGATAINGGTLQYAKTNSMPTTGGVTNGATLAVNAGGTGEWTNATSGGGTIGGLIVGTGGQGTSNQVTWSPGSTLGIDTTNATGGTLTYSGSIGSFHAASGTTDSVGLAKLGAGTLKLDNATGSTYTGGTTISGTLNIANTSGSATGSGPLTVNADGTLSGTGKVAGPVSVAGTLSPGNSPGTIDITGNLTFNSTGKFNYEIDSSAAPASGADLVTVSGALSISPTAQLNASDLSNLVLPANTKFTLISYGGAWDGGTFASHPDDSLITVGANQFVLNYNDTSGGSNFGGGTYTNFITLTAVPEANAFWLGGAICLLVGLTVGTRKILGKRAAA